MNKTNCLVVLKLLGQGNGAEHSAVLPTIDQVWGAAADFDMSKKHNYIVLGLGLRTSNDCPPACLMKNLDKIPNDPNFFFSTVVVNYMTRGDSPGEAVLKVVLFNLHTGQIHKVTAFNY
ncbi:hypothetical protein ACJX0J_005978 [Zea mays]